MFCEKCGKELSDSANFCKFCGQEVSGSIGSSQHIITESPNKSSVDIQIKPFQNQRKVDIFGNDTPDENDTIYSSETKDGCFKYALIGCGILAILLFVFISVNDNDAKPTNTHSKTTATAPVKKEPEETPEMKSARIDKLLQDQNTFLDSKFDIENMMTGNDILDAIRNFSICGKRLQHAYKVGSEEQELLATKYLKKLSTVQVKYFPKLRKQWTKNLDRILWEQDMSARTSGSKSDQIHFTGVIFASNSQISKFQTIYSSQLERLRFRKSNYWWIQNATTYTTYDLKDNLKDSEIEKDEE